MKPRDILLDDETLFKDEEVFTPSYVPEDFIHRDSQLSEITLSLKPGLRGANPVNTLIYGPPGTGKTTAVRYVFNEARETSSKMIPVYVNCDDHNTRFSVFAKIHEEVVGHAPPDTGKPLNAVKEKIFRKLVREDKTLTVALDEIDQLFLNNTVDPILLDLLKAHTTYGFDKVGVIGILVDDKITSNLDCKSASVYNPVKIQFPPYTRREIHDILSMRVKYGLYDRVLSDDALDYIVEKTHISGDLRVGIELIRRSALNAEKDSARKITMEHVETAYLRETRTLRLRETIQSLDNIEKKTLAIVAAEGTLRSGELYRRIKTETGTGVKKYNQVVARLEHLGLTESVPVRGRGQTRDIRLRHDPVDVAAHLT